MKFSLYLITLYKTPAIIRWHSIRVAVTHERNETEKGKQKRIQSLLTHTPGGKPVETTTTSWFCSLLLFSTGRPRENRLFFQLSIFFQICYQGFFFSLIINPISYYRWKDKRVIHWQCRRNRFVSCHTRYHKRLQAQKKKSFFKFKTTEKRNEQDGLSTTTVGWLHTLRLKLESGWVPVVGLSSPIHPLYPPSGHVDTGIESFLFKF